MPCIYSCFSPKKLLPWKLGTRKIPWDRLGSPFPSIRTAETNEGQTLPMGAPELHEVAHWLSLVTSRPNQELAEYSDPLPGLILDGHITFLQKWNVDFVPFSRSLPHGWSPPVAPFAQAMLAGHLKARPREVSEKSQLCAASRWVAAYGNSSNVAGWKIPFHKGFQWESHGKSSMKRQFQLSCFIGG